jgi:hypothetical protein
MHDYISFRVRGDGHTYIASVRTDQLTGGDEEAWQAPLPTRCGDEESWQAPLPTRCGGPGREPGQLCIAANPTMFCDPNRPHTLHTSVLPPHPPHLSRRSDGQWEDVKIDFDDFIFTFR